MLQAALDEAKEQLRKEIAASHHSRFSLIYSRLNILVFRESDM
jgi:hypothetical protein